MLCNCCGEQRERLHVKESVLMKGNKLTLCSDCLSGKHEPRYMVILVGLSDGLDAVAPYIRNHRHHGDPIKAKEIIK